MVLRRCTFNDDKSEGKKGYRRSSSVSIFKEGSSLLKEVLRCFASKECREKIDVLGEQKQSSRGVKSPV
jgi:hypothetical protein